MQSFGNIHRHNYLGVHLPSESMQELSLNFGGRVHLGVHLPTARLEELSFNEARWLQRPRYLGAHLPVEPAIHVNVPKLYPADIALEELNGLEQIRHYFMNRI